MKNLKTAVVPPSIHAFKRAQWEGICYTFYSAKRTCLSPAGAVGKTGRNRRPLI